jgi:hypothetical protein
MLTMQREDDNEMNIGQELGTSNALKNYETMRHTTYQAFKTIKTVQTRHKSY